MTQTFHHYLAVVEVRNQALDAVEADLVGWCGRPPFDWQVARLAAYRGVTRLGALTLAAEVADWRRFAHASQFMGFCGLVPSELLQRQPRPPWPAHQGRQRPPARPAGLGRPSPTSTAPASAPRSPAANKACPLRSSPARGRPPGACRAALRTLAARKPTKSIVAAAIARELAGFLWAEGTA